MTEGRAKGHYKESPLPRTTSAWRHWIVPRRWRTSLLSTALIAALLAIVHPATLPAADEPKARGTAGSFRVAAIQFMSEFGKPELNRNRLEPLIREAAQGGAKIVVLPETAITGYMNYDLDTTWQAGELPLTEGLRGVSPEGVAETVPGPSTERFARLADELDIFLTIPFLETDRRANKFYNTVVLAGPEGKILLHYRKLNPWPFAERSWASAGDRGLQCVDTPYGRLALLICYDINFEPRHLKTAEADTLLYSIAWVDKANSPWFRASLPGIAKENDLNIVGANWTVPRKPSWHGYGQSLIVARSGQVLARAAHDIGEEILYADLPLNQKARSPEHLENASHQ